MPYTPTSGPLHRLVPPPETVFLLLAGWPLLILQILALGALLLLHCLSCFDCVWRCNFHSGKCTKLHVQLNGFYTCTPQCTHHPDHPHTPVDMLSATSPRGNQVLTFPTTDSFLAPHKGNNTVCFWFVLFNLICMRSIHVAACSRIVLFLCYVVLYGMNISQFMHSTADGHVGGV